MRTNSQTKLSTKMHNECQAIVDKAVESGVKIKVYDAMRREVSKPLSKGRKKQ